MKWLITGGTGRLGRVLIRSLARRDDLSLTIMIHKTNLRESQCRIVNGDLMDPKSLKEASTGMDGVIHLGALTHNHKEKAYFDINLVGTKNLVNACLQNGVRRFIHVSTRAANPRGGGYAASKFQAEEFIKKQNLAWVMIKPAEVYGPDTSDFINKVVKCVRYFPAVPIFGDGKYEFAPVYIDDFLSAFVRVVLDSKLEKKIFILAGPESISYIDLIERLQSYFGVRRLKISLPMTMISLLTRFMFYFQSNMLVSDQIPRLLCAKETNFKLAKEFLDFHPRKLEAGLSEYFP